jgi:rRNA maturation endonuclease Nob1
MKCIPLKPTIRTHRHTGYTLNCARCGKILTQGTVTPEHRYCQWCGQQTDYSGIHERLADELMAAYAE